MAEPLRIPIRFVGPEDQELSLGEFVAVRKDVLTHQEAVAESARRAEWFISTSIGGTPQFASDQQPRGYTSLDLIRELQERLNALSAADHGPNVIQESASE